MGSSETGHSGWFCWVCQDSETLGGAKWHRLIDQFIVGVDVGHGQHPWWMAGDCASTHELCYWPTYWHASGTPSLTGQELTRGISQAVAAQDVMTLAGYVTLPAVGLFAERSAIQVRGCDGETILGHIPVNPELLAAVEAVGAQPESGG